MTAQAIVNISIQSFGGLFSVMILLCMWFRRTKWGKLGHSYVRVLLCNIFLQAFNILSWVFDGRQGVVGGAVVRVANFFMFLCSYLLVAVFTDYFAACIAQRGGSAARAARACWLCAGVGAAVLLLSQVLPIFYYIDAQNLYRRGAYYWLSNAIGIVAMLPGLWVLLCHRRLLLWKERAAFFAYYSIPIAAAISHIFVYGVESLHLATTFVVASVYLFIQAEQANILSEKELELERSRTAIALSQIQPHFLYNALVGIKELCDSGEQQETSRALEYFAHYLRGNLDSLSAPRLISFEREVGHVKDYLYLEKIRFEEKLNIVWELNVDDFFLPPLTLQPLVENAVRHGVTEKSGGGTVAIRSERRGDSIIVAVTDDGVGFGENKAGGGARTHIGIQNVRGRLRAQCGGELLVKSKPHAGTTATMILPVKEVRRNENTGG